MKITHRLFASIVISAMTFIFLLAVTEGVSQRQQGSQEIRTLINQMDKEFLQMQIEMRDYPDTTLDIDKLFAQISATRQQLETQDTGKLFHEINELTSLLDSYQHQYSKLIDINKQLNNNPDKNAPASTHKQTIVTELGNTETAITNRIHSFDKRLEKYIERKDLSLERIRWISISLIVIISLILTNYLVGSFTRPFKRLVAHINMLAAGQLNIQTDITGKDELGQLGKVLNSMSRQLDRAFNELKSERDLLHSTVEQLKKTQQDLQQSETRYNRLFETSADAILILQGEKIMQCNRAALELFRVATTDAFKKLRFSDLCAEKQENGEDSFISINQHIAAAYKQGEHEFSWLYKHQNGETFSAYVIFTMVDLGYTQLLQAAIRQCCVQDSGGC